MAGNGAAKPSPPLTDPDHPRNRLLAIHNDVLKSRIDLIYFMRYATERLDRIEKAIEAAQKPAQRTADDSDNAK